MKQLPFTRLLSLASRQLLRDARAGELRVLFFALLVAVAASTAIGYFSARLNDGMLLRATEFLAADLRLTGSSPALQQQIDTGKQLGLEHARLVEFSSVVARSSGLNCAHKPVWASRNVGTPDSALMPAPVSTAMWCALPIQSRTVDMFSCVDAALRRGRRRWPPTR